MLKRLISELAEEVGIKLTAINLVDGPKVGVLGVKLLKLHFLDHEEGILLHQAEAKYLESGIISPKLKRDIKITLMDLKLSIVEGSAPHPKAPAQKL